MVGPTTGQRSAQSMARGILPVCKMEAGGHKSNYYGFVHGDGEGLMHDTGTHVGAFHIQEVSGFSHIPLRYYYTQAKMQGYLYNIHTTDELHWAEITLYSLETGGGDTCVEIGVDFQTAPPPVASTLEFEFKPTCGGLGGRPSYQGPYYNYEDANIEMHPVTCI